MALYLAEKDATAAAPARLREAWKPMSPHFANLRPDQIDRELCRSYVALRRTRKVGDGTIGKELGTLRAGLRWADPRTSAVIELPSLPPPRERYLTREEARRLIANADAPHVKLFVVLALTTAGRKEAVLELAWDRVDFDRGIIRLGQGERRAKGRATVPMHDLARPLLLEARRAALTDYVIEWGGRRLRSIRKGFSQACRRAQLREVSPHVLRHTAAVWMAEAGVPMSEIAQYLGHSDDRITQRVYSRFSPEHLRRAAGAIGW
ncbi:MAG: tyrosine-type recombinase/integrase [Gammaproteobacteria bacterium]